MKTKDYSKFKFAEENRKTKKALVEKLKESMKKHGFVAGRPILINGDWVIVDGQNRFKAAKELDIAIHYEFIEGDYIETMIDLNSSQSNWSLQDYINSYATQNVDCYRKMVKFEEKYKLGCTNNISICIATSMKSSFIRQGKEFEFNSQTEEIASFLFDCENIVPYWKNKEFVRSIVTLFKKTNDKQREVIRLNLIAVPMLSNIRDYLVCYENILNRRKKESQKIKL